MIIYVRSSLVQRDVRAQKYIHFLKEKEFKFIQWDRQNEFDSYNEQYITYKLNAGFGERLKSFFKFLGWNLFLFKNIFKHRKKISVIQICDLDSFFGVVLFKLLGIKLVFDVYDFFTDSKLTKTDAVTYKLLYHIEMLSLRASDLLILPLEIRKKHLNFNHENIFICENVPLINTPKEIDIAFDESVLNVVYAGTLEADYRGLEWIPSIAKKLKKEVHFYIAGFGGLNDFFKNASNNNDNITFLGPLSHEEAMSLQSKGDIIYGIYRTSLMNNIMAAPNKFYESAYLGKPIVVNTGLMISELIENNGIGFVVDENEEALMSLFQNLTKEEIKSFSNKALEFWDRNYADYIESKYNREYQNHLALLSKK